MSTHNYLISYQTSPSKNLSTLHPSAQWDVEHRIMIMVVYQSQPIIFQTLRHPG